MKLSKFFRRYSRPLLMIFMSLLLVAFLLGDILQSAGRKLSAQNVKLGHAFGRDIYSKDYQDAAAKQGLLLQLGFSSVRNVDALDMYLLMEEARRAGVRIGRDEAKAAVSQALGERADEQLAAVQQRYRRSYSSMFDEAAEWLAVLELLSVQNDALNASLPREELAYRDQKQQADVLLSVLDSKAFVQFVPEPSEEELQAFFDETKDRPTHHTEDALQFGYLQPDRVQIEYLTVDPKKLESRVRVREKDVQAFFEAHAQNYMKTVTPPPETQSSQPATPTRVPQTFEEARDQVRRDVRSDLAIAEAQRLVHEIRREGYGAWQLMPRDEAGFRKQPAADALVSFEALRDRFADRGEVTIGTSGLVTAEQLADQFDTTPKFMRSRQSTEPMYRDEQPNLSLSQLAMRAKGLYQPEKSDTRVVLNELEPSPVLIREDQNPGTRQRGPYQAFFFRVVAIKPAGPPDALDQVRTQLVDDYKLLKAHELAGQYAAQLAQRAKEIGLAAAVAEATELKERLTQADQANQFVGPPAPDVPEPPRNQFSRAFEPAARTLTRTGSAGQGFGDTKKLQREAFALAGQNTASAESGFKVACVDVASAFRWGILELKDIKPLYAGDFDQQRATVLRQKLSDYHMALARAWLSPDAVRTRVGFVSAREATTTEDSEP